MKKYPLPLSCGKDAMILDNIGKYWYNPNQQINLAEIWPDCCQLVFLQNRRLRVVSNFGNRLWGRRNIHMRAREISRRRYASGGPKIRDYRLSQGV